ncbi:hypothetical protein V8F20_012868 [Naviculisporaceae sp. PSN 640]
MKRIWSRLNPHPRVSRQQSAVSHNIDIPADGSTYKPDEEPVSGFINKPEERPVEELVNGSASKPTTDRPHNEPASTQFTLEVKVIPVCENYDTPASTLSKGLVRLSKAMVAMNGLPSVKSTPGETGAMASLIINALNIIATVPTKDRPERISSYHVYATRTGMATFFNLMSIVRKHRPEEVYSNPTAATILEDTTSAFIHFGITILRTPAPYSAHIAAAIGVEVNNASSHTSALSSEKANSIAKALMQTLEANVSRPSNPAPDQYSAPRQTDIRPLVSIFTSDQLAGLARRMAHSCKNIDRHDPDGTAKWFCWKLLDLNLNAPPQFCPCGEESKKYPICLCDVNPFSQSAYEKNCSWKLLPII